MVDDFLRCTWVTFLREKSKIYKKIEVERDLSIKHIRSDHGREFENHKFLDWCDEMGVKHEYSIQKTLQQNGVVERKNRTLFDMATSMFTSKDLVKRFWAKVVNTTCYVSNRVLEIDKTIYEIWNVKKPTVKFFKVFGSTCYILRDREHLEKFDKKSDVTK